MAIVPGTEPVIKAAQHWKQTFLLNRRGVLEDHEYSAETFDELKKRFVDNPIEGGDASFFGKLEQQMNEASPEACRLMAELFWVLHLAVMKLMKPDTKKRQIETVWGWGGSKLPSSEWLEEKVLSGAGHPGTAFAIQKWRELRMAVLLLRDWWNLPEKTQKELGNDPARFAEWIDEKEYGERRNFRHMLLYLLFPQDFERIFSTRPKRRILKFYKHNFDEKNRFAIDEALKQLRDELTPEYDAEFSFYTTPGANDWRIEPPQGKSPPPGQKISSLNRIFYGPPGTGKTYHTVNAALEILDPEFYESNSNNRNKLKARFDELFKEESRIEFVTFHQSFSYEDFIEGLKAITDEEGNIHYKIENGVFRELCERARSGENYLSVEQALKELKKECTDEPKPMKTITGKEIRVSYSGGKTFRIKTEKNSEDTLHTASADAVRRVCLGEDHSNFANSSYVWAIANYLKDNYGLGEEVTSSEREPHVLIIDEINRGNISAIFGELITLIEASKRQGADEALSVKLPYSKERFTVPDNVYIIGTMNTADRSLAVLDTALRRRFEFIEMMPQLEILSGITVANINIASMLKAINERIETLYDREHTIGHTFFLSLKDDDSKDDDNLGALAKIFKRNVLPLLQEYFFEDWGKIRYVLNNNAFIQEAKATGVREPAQDYGGNDKKLYRINSDALNNADAYRTIYE